MRDINVVAIECMRELDVIGIQYGNVVEFKVNYRAERRWGAVLSTSRRSLFN